MTEYGYVVELYLENRDDVVYVSEFFVGDQNPKYSPVLIDAKIFYGKGEARDQAQTAEEVYKQISGRDDFCNAKIRQVQITTA